MNVEQKAPGTNAWMAEVLRGAASQIEILGRVSYVDHLRSIAAYLDARALEQREAVTVYGPGSNTGHGHVWKRPDGVTARCGGPVLCLSCRADAKFYATPPRDVPDGWVLVPVEPTPEMVNAACAIKLRRLNELASGKDGNGIEAGIREDYSAMLAAAPKENE